MGSDEKEDSLLFTDCHQYIVKRYCVRRTRIVAGILMACWAMIALAVPVTAAVWPQPHWEVRAPSDKVDRAKLDAVIQSAIDSGPEGTRAILVVEDGAIIAERYAPGYDANTRFPSYSMAKSYTSTLVGILVSQGRLGLDGPAPVPEWSSPGDPRGKIRLVDLLNMSSGIHSIESESRQVTDTAAMLFGAGRKDVARHGADHPLKYVPGRYWMYSNSTSNVLSGIVRRHVGDTKEAYLKFINDYLFEPLGMRSTTLGFDARGTFVGSTYVWATARDYAKLGLLYLRGGKWNGQHILAKNWPKFVSTPAPASKGEYGGHFWLGPQPSAKAQDPALANASDWPADEYSARGLFGQVISISPSKRLVVVILGHTLHLPEGKGNAIREHQIMDIYRTVQNSTEPEKAGSQQEVIASVSMVKDAKSVKPYARKIEKSLTTVKSVDVPLFDESLLPDNPVDESIQTTAYGLAFLNCACLFVQGGSPEQCFADWLPGMEKKRQVDTANKRVVVNDGQWMVEVQYEGPSFGCSFK
ncbi:MAG: serine hydrolase [Rhodospirillales bacterium]|nr:serine hydrolase [Rhodospirillales bacterium]